MEQIFTVLASIVGTGGATAFVMKLLENRRADRQQAQTLEHQHEDFLEAQRKAFVMEVAAERKAFVLEIKKELDEARERLDVTEAALRTLANEHHECRRENGQLKRENAAQAAEIAALKDRVKRLEDARGAA